MHASDEYHPVIAFDGAASDSLERFVNEMEGYGVTLTLEDGSEVDAVLLGLVYDEQSERQLTKFYRAADGDYPTVNEIDPDDVEYAFATRIQVS